jgi:selenide, water dikinase
MHTASPPSIKLSCHIISNTRTHITHAQRIQAKGSWVKNAYDSMLQSNREAAHILSTYGCSACTDITGFGLMGHLLEMIKFDDDQNQTREEDAENQSYNGEVVGVDTTESSNICKVVTADDSTTGEIEMNNNDIIGKTETVQIAVKLSIKAVPVLLGATECINDGIFSSLQPQNIRCARAVGNIHLGKLNSSYPLLYDPQVCTDILLEQHIF